MAKSIILLEIEFLIEDLKQKQIAKENEGRGNNWLVMYEIN